MHFSATSYIMAILGGNCLICFLCIIMKYERISQMLGIRFLKYFSFFILFRMMLPFEFFHTITVPSEKILPKIIDYCMQTVFFTVKNISITPYLLFLSIWLSGVVYILCITVKKYMNLYRITQYFPNLADDSDNDVSTILTDIYNTLPVHHPVKKVIRTRFVNTPCVIGFFSPIVFLPDFDFTQEELYCILFHELSHLRHMDFIWMLFIEILCIFNWWNPFVILLRARMADIMEFHADNTTFVNLPSIHRKQYLDCLIKISRNQKTKPPLSEMTLPFAKNSSSSLTCRVMRLINSKSYRLSTNCFIMTVAVLLLFTSTLFIIEPSWMPEEELNGEVFSLDEDNDYLLMQSDGTYDLYIDESYVSTLQNCDTEGICNLPVYYME